MMSKSRILCAFSIPFLIVVLGGSAVHGTRASFFVNASGAAIDPYVGNIDGELSVTGYDESGSGLRTWTIEGQLVAIPPTPEEDWWSIDDLLGRQYPIWQIVKGIIDLVCSVDAPDNSTALGALTENNYQVGTYASNTEFGIVGVATAINSGTAVCSGTVDIVINGEFPYCLNEYETTGVLRPDGPGRAILQGRTRLFLEGESFLELSFQNVYTFDESLVLEDSYWVTNHATYTITQGAEQDVLTVTETYSEGPVYSTYIPVVHKANVQSTK